MDPNEGTLMQMPGFAAAEDALTVTQFNQLMNQVIEGAFPRVMINAEISEFTRAGSGHLYFTLKDERSQVSAVMWRGSAQSLPFHPRAGLSVTCVGRPNVYHVSGRLQFVVAQMSLGGEGLLRQKFLELKAKLEKEGLFLEERKRAIPFLPRAIGIVTAARGAVIHDMMVKLRERMPSVPVYLVDVRVQGGGSAEEIAAGIQLLSSSGLIDVLIVARGGGSLEDLWSFNEEVVVRAIFAARVPVISGVGHEVDTTLCDLVADRRAPTPTAAAEMAVPRRDDLLVRLRDFEVRLSSFERWLQPKAQRLDELEQLLLRRVRLYFERAHLLLNQRASRLESVQPRRIVELWGERVENCRMRFERGFQQLLQRKQHQLERIAGRWQALNPTAVLGRGFALVTNDRGIVRDAAQVAIGEKVNIRLAAGAVGAVVEQITNEKDKRS